MKNFTILLFFISLQFSCDSQSKEKTATKNNNGSDKIENDSIKYEIDTLKVWYTQKPKSVIEFMKNSGQKKQFKEDEIVAMYTYNKYPAVNYPSIMIVNTKTYGEQPPLDQLERELGAISISLEDVERKNEIELSDAIQGFDFKNPILIKEKQLILMESSAKLLNNQTLKIRQSMYFRGINVILIQFSYIEGRDEKLLKDFNRVVETIKF